MGVTSLDEEQVFERLAGKYVNAAFILRQNVFAVRTEAKIKNVGPKWLREFLSKQHSRQLFVAGRLFMCDDLLPPIAENRIGHGLAVGNACSRHSAN